VSVAGAGIREVEENLDTRGELSSPTARLCDTSRLGFAQQSQRTAQQAFAGFAIEARAGVEQAAEPCATSAKPTAAIKATRVACHR
jgi:hypothetical protein